MLLTIDIGNTTLTIGLFTDNELKSKWRLATDHDRLTDEYGLQILGLCQQMDLSLEDIQGICLSSVVPALTNRITSACRNYLNHEPFIVDHSVKTGVKILYDRPEGVGSDRIADAAAVQQIYGGPACVIDFGTATTFNALTEEGEYLGGAISPGVSIASEALFKRAAKLPSVELKTPPSVIGRNTVHAIQSGLVLGYVSLVEGMVARFKAELGPKTKVIATGGNSRLIAQHTNSIEIISPWLTLEGLRIIWQLNHP